MAEGSLVRDVLSELRCGGSVDSYLASSDERHAEWLRKFNDGCDEYGTWEHRTPEQQAALDAFMAENPVETVEIRTEEDLYAWLRERYIATHGRVSLDPGLCGMNVDWARVRKMAEARGHAGILDDIHGAG